jgi:predicted nucleic acid-binding protein
MIILDTNVISEFMREKPDIKVKAWLDRQKPIHLFITTITVAEIKRGLARMPVGKRRAYLEAAFNDFMAEAFTGRVYPFDKDAADLYGDIAACGEKSGFHVDAVYLMIAAIAKNQRTQIATRNTKEFKGCGIELINPWL